MKIIYYECSSVLKTLLVNDDSAPALSVTCKAGVHLKPVFPPLNLV